MCIKKCYLHGTYQISNHIGPFWFCQFNFSIILGEINKTFSTKSLKNIGNALYEIELIINWS